MKYKKIVVRIVFVTLLLAIILIMFRDSMTDILEELLHTPKMVVVLVSLLAILFHLIEGSNIYCMARRFNKEFSQMQGVASSLYSCFFTTITLGAASFVAEPVYLSQRKIPPAKSLGLITVQFVVQKVCIAAMATIFAILNYDFIKSYYEKQFGLLLFGLIMTILIVISMIAIVTSEKFHVLVIHQADKYIKKVSLKAKIAAFEQQLRTMRRETTLIFRDKKLMFRLFFQNIMKLLCWFFVPAIVLGYQFPEFAALFVGMAAIVTALAGVVPCPAGIGSTEFLYMILFSPLVGEIKAASSLLIYRYTISLLPSILGGGVALLNQQYGRHKQ